MFTRYSVPFAWCLALMLGCGARKQAADHPPPVERDSQAGVEPAAPHVSTKVEAVEDLESAFKRAITTAEPAVVSIYSSKTVTLPGLGMPFGGDPLFERFFELPQAHPREFWQEDLGSGFVIDEAGHILTNNHVIEGAEEIRVKLADDRDWVLAIGSPYNLRRTVSAGIVSATGRAHVGIVDYEERSDVETMGQHFFAEILIVLGLAVAVAAPLHWLGLPAIIGYMAVGVLVGPHTFNLLPDARAWVRRSELGIGQSGEQRDEATDDDRKPECIVGVTRCDAEHRINARAENGAHAVKSETRET